MEKKRDSLDREKDREREIETEDWTGRTRLGRGCVQGNVEGPGFSFYREIKEREEMEKHAAVAIYFIELLNLRLEDGLTRLSLSAGDGRERETAAWKFSLHGYRYKKFPPVNGII